MSPSRVGIVDYGVGNIKSVSNALAAIGAVACVSAEPAVLKTCDRLILPGVGAFPHGMAALAARGLPDFLRDQVAIGKPLLGICLGMQMLMDYSTEFAVTPGLGLVAGGIEKLQPPEPGAGPPVAFRLPNVGWLTLQRSNQSEDLGSQLLSGIAPSSRFYFVHSFCAGPDNDCAAAISDYDGVRFASVIASGSVVGTQFHPEKSGPEGLRILKNFTL